MSEKILLLQMIATFWKVDGDKFLHFRISVLEEIFEEKLVTMEEKVEEKSWVKESWFLAHRLEERWPQRNYYPCQSKEH